MFTSMKNKTKSWVRVPWGGNPALGFECYRRSFPGGAVSVGIGPFKLIVFHRHGSSTREREDREWTEDEAMARVEAANGEMDLL